MTKYYNIWSICLLIILLVSSSSCKKFLDKKSADDLNVPSTLDDLQGLLDDALNMNTGLTPSLGEALSDNIFLTQANYDTRVFYEKELYIWRPVDYVSFSNDWSNSYKPVYNSNYCLEAIQKIPLTSNNIGKWNNVKGSAFFYRAYNFLNLLWNYSKAYDPTTSQSDLGIALRLTSDYNAPSIRASVKQSYEQVISDAKEAVKLLPLSSLHVYRPSRVAAYGLLARTYLSMRIYDSALVYSDLYLQHRSELINCNSDPEFTQSPTSTTPFKRFNKETIFHTEINASSTFLGSPRGKIDTVLYSSYSNTDWRKTAYFEINAGYNRFKGSYAGSIGNNFSGIATDEIYLIRSECYARRNNPGDKDLALADLNSLLIKRFKPPFVAVTAGTADQALDIILIERRKELVYRGLRWMDIKRLNKEGRNIILTRFVSGQIHTLQPNANYYALPIPADIIAITGMPQNPF